MRIKHRLKRRQIARVCLAIIASLFMSAQAFSAEDPQASLQRGARIYMNYCAGCHSLTYLRYDRMAKDIGLVSEDGQVDLILLKNNLIFTHARPQAPIEVSMPPDDARQWFGIVPPDLSLITRQRSPDWIAAYLKGFYPDPSRPFGTNNHMLPGAAMPDILGPLHHSSVGESGSEHFDELVSDLVNFLVYVGEPIKNQRKGVGLVVLIFLFILLGFVYCLKCFYNQGRVKRSARH